MQRVQNTDTNLVFQTDVFLILVAIRKGPQALMAIPVTAYSEFVHVTISLRLSWVAVVLQQRLLLLATRLVVKRCNVVSQRGHNLKNNFNLKKQVSTGAPLTYLCR